MSDLWRVKTSYLSTPFQGVAAPSRPQSAPWHKERRLLKRSLQAASRDRKTGTPTFLTHSYGSLWFIDQRT